MLCLGRWELYFMLECFDVYRERLHASLVSALFPETIKLRSWIINFVSLLEAVPECSFQSVVLQALHMSIEAIMPSNHLILWHPLLLLPPIFPRIRVFSNESVFTSGGQSIGVSASEWVLPMNIQELFPLEFTGWISLQFKRLSRVFSKSINSSVANFFIVQLSHPYITTGKTIALTSWTFFG